LFFRGSPKGLKIRQDGKKEKTLKKKPHRDELSEKRKEKMGPRGFEPRLLAFRFIARKAFAASTKNPELV